MITLSLRHLRRHWRLNLALLLCLTLASATLASLSSYATAVATKELGQDLGQAQPAERTLLITGTPYTFSEALYDLLQEKLGDAFLDRLVIRHATLPADPQPLLEGSGQPQTVASLDVTSFDDLADRVQVVEGRLPDQIDLSEATGRWPPPIEAVIGARAAEESGYGIGDRLSASRWYHRLDIVGLVEPLDPDDDSWGQDLGAFAVHSGTAETIALPLIITPESMKSYLLGPVFPHQVSWRITLDQQSIGADSGKNLHSDLINFQTQATIMGAKTHTGLVQILAKGLAKVSRNRMPFLLITLLTLVLVLYTLTMFASFVVDRSQGELETLGGQGASAGQISQVFALEALYLAAPAALILGPGLAGCVTQLWGKINSVIVPVALFREAWLLSAAVAGLGWLVLVLSIWMAARRTVRGEQRTSARPPQQTFLQRTYLDLYLLAFGALLYWQLGQTGSFVMRRLGNSQLADPLLLIGPALLFIAITLVSLRLLPILLQAVARLVQPQRGLVLSLSLCRLARDPVQASRMAFLVSLTASLNLFAYTLGDSLARSAMAVDQQSGNQLSALQPGTLAQGINQTLQLNTFMLTLFSVSAFFIIYYLSARARTREFGILGTMGLSVRQGLAILATEGLLVLLLGLLAGIILGLGLSAIMTPYFSELLIGAPGGNPIEQGSVDWPTIAWLYLSHLITYGAAMVLLLAGFARARVPGTLWKEDE